MFSNGQPYTHTTVPVVPGSAATVVVTQGGGQQHHHGHLFGHHHGHHHGHQGQAVVVVQNPPAPVATVVQYPPVPVYAPGNPYVMFGAPPAQQAPHQHHHHQHGHGW